MNACNLSQTARQRGLKLHGNERVLPLHLDEMLKDVTAPERRRIGTQVVNCLPQFERHKIDEIVAEASGIESNKVKPDQRIQAAFYVVGHAARSRDIPIQTLLAEVVAAKSMRALAGVPA